MVFIFWHQQQEIDKHSNCLGFAGTVPLFGMLSRCPGLNQFVPVFRFLSKKIFIFTQFFISRVKTYAFSLLGSIIYSNSYLEWYKKHNSFELNKIVILKTFDWNVRAIFRETCVRFLRTFFFSYFLKTLK